MKTVSIREFNRHFRRLRKERCHVKDRGEIVGTWTPIPKQSKPLDVMARLRKTFSKPLPFTGAELLKETRR